MMDAEIIFLFDGVSANAGKPRGDSCSLWGIGETPIGQKLEENFQKTNIT